ncbi:hypothetical protein UFOVP27_133 [uncultured Caudovirales phage]|uniref:DUF7455 domain-containing protein n=1 Tax=uncultured Caudovirales phage TaxID=2100421 RepID=A0A6J5KJF9_9CAUD|nr:hypothetical protein UFOVP27_133 [uncultured Caudovirales phage]
MTQVAEAPLKVEEGRIQCDQCSARAMYGVELPYGFLTFCNHHYNKNVLALTEQGGIAKLLDSLDENLGEL